MAIITCFQNVPATWQEYWKIMVRHGFLILWGKKKNRGGACPPEKWGNETLVTDNSVALFLFLLQHQ